MALRLRSDAVNILAIDPGSEESAWVVYDNGRLVNFAIDDNERLLGRIRLPRGTVEGDILSLRHDAVVIERIASYGMAVGESVFETVRWAGRFEEAAHPLPVHRVTRREVKLHLCGQSRAKDANVRQALIDRYGGVGGKEAAVGRKAAPGPLYGVSKDVWAALAVAVTWADTQEAA